MLILALVVVALGGNAFLRKNDRLSEQWRNVSIASTVVAKLVEDGYDIVLTHGNGPQVGILLEWMYGSKTRYEPVTLDIADAMTQGWLGYMLQQAIGNALSERGLRRRVVTIVTQVLVNRHDGAFSNPTKFIGPFYSDEEAKKLEEVTGWIFKRDPRGGYRRVVPSPKPIEVVELEAIKKLVEEGYIVIAVGGGGIPVVKTDKWLHGVEAVIDKDLASALLASNLRADIFTVLTDVDRVYIDYGKPTQQPLEKLTVEEAKKLLRAGQFPPGSMGPKIEATIYFLENNPNAKYASIGLLEEGHSVVKGESGTLVIKS